jgi:hypothetical protein
MDLLIFAKVDIGVPQLYRALISAPKSREQARSQEWQRESFCYACLAQGEKQPKSSRQAEDFDVVADYWLRIFPEWADRTRSIVESSFLSMIDTMNRGVLKELFCRETNLTPEAVEDGKIIVVDLPLKEFGDVGRYAAALWKYCFQGSIERRDMELNQRPVFLWQDEGQNFVLSSDMMFQSTCRSCKVSTVVLTQNISSFYAAIGSNGETGKAQVDSLFANLCTKFCHSNGDSVTNEWNASSIGQTKQLMLNASSSFNNALDTRALLAGSGNSSCSGGVSESITFEVPPKRFSELRTPSPDNGWAADAIVFRHGRRFRASGRMWMQVTFDQKVQVSL